MGETTAISWCDSTFNGWVGCQRVSPGCVNCFAEAQDHHWHPKDGHWGPLAPRSRTSEANWRKPIAWNKKAAALKVRPRVFCSSLSDVFEDRPELAPWRADLFKLIHSTPHLDWLLLTKRPENAQHLWMRAMSDAFPPGQFSDGTKVPAPKKAAPWLPNIWLGTTVEDQRRAEDRIPHLLDVPARIRFLSVEPQLEAISLTDIKGEACPDCGGPTTWNALDPAAYCATCCECYPGELLAIRGVDWVIQGAESGHGARPFLAEWAHDLAAQCEEAGTAYFLKQLGARFVDAKNGVVGKSCAVEPEALASGNTRRLKNGHGADMAEWPADLRALGQAFPKVKP